MSDPDESGSLSLDDEDSFEKRGVGTDLRRTVMQTRNIFIYETDPLSIAILLVD